jgi:hypothetical protein
MCPDVQKDYWEKTVDRPAGLSGALWNRFTVCLLANQQCASLTGYRDTPGIRICCYLDKSRLQFQRVASQRGLLAQRLTESLTNLDLEPTASVRLPVSMEFVACFLAARRQQTMVGGW